MEQFNIYLPSNVSPEAFPNNSPSQFSTILSDEINLDGKDWEVGVQNILYPSHVSTTTANDTIKVYEPVDESRELFGKGKSSVKVKYDLKLDPHKLLLQVKRDNILRQVISHNEGQHVAAFLNENKWSRDLGLFKFEYKDAQKKFVLHVMQQDMYVGLSSLLRVYLGFTSNGYFKGSYWSWSAFDPKKEVPPLDGRAYFYVTDISVVQKEEVEFEKSYDRANEKWIFTANIRNRFRNSKDDDLLYEPQLEFSLDPSAQFLRIRPTKLIPRNLLKYEMPMRVLRFDVKSAKALGIDNHKNNFSLFDDNAHTIQTTATFHIPHKTATEMRELVGIKGTLYFADRREKIDTYKREVFKLLTIKTNKEIEKPQDLLPFLNADADNCGFKFSFIESLKRFHIDITGRYYIEMSPSLRSILGFGNYAGYPARAPTSFRGDVFPVLRRSITTLYTYTNIVDVVHVGDVKAALLLACPFNPPKDSIVHQIEFLRPTYSKVNRQVLKQIDIEIRDDAGELIPFLYGKSVITLHFRQIK